MRRQNAKRKAQPVGASGRLSGAAPLTHLSDAALQNMFDSFHVPQSGRNLIAQIRIGQPSRKVRTNQASGVLRYVSRKMGRVLAAEAFATEFVAFVEWDFDPATLEIYPQPAALTLTYEAPTGRRTKVHHTPDCFRITTGGFVFTECKTEDRLEALADAQPGRYNKDADGRWRCPPGEQAAAALGCIYEIRSPRENNFALYNNLELLKHHLCRNLPDVSSSEKAIVQKKFEGRNAVSAFDLVHMEPRIDADDLYSMLVRGEIYFPLHSLRLDQQESAFFFLDERDWHNHELFLDCDRPERRVASLTRELRPGDTFHWKGTGYRVVSSDTKALSVVLFDGAGEIVNLATRQVERLIQSGDIALNTRASTEVASSAAEIFATASRERLQEAAWKFEVLRGTAGSDNPLRSREKRTKAYWQSAFRAAETLHGNGLIGLLPNRNGNRKRRVSEETLALAEKYITEHYCTPDQHTVRHVHALYSLAAESLGLDALSYVSLCKLVKGKGGHAQTASRVGEKGAYELEEQYLELEYTTPRHGLHSWHIGHIDHTPLPLKFVASPLGELADTVWLTILMGAFDRKIRGYYLSFDPPSYRSCMMAVRDCVRRHNRFFSMVVSDGGSDFTSANYEGLISALAATKRDRLRGQPRYGSVCERIFGVGQQDLIHHLQGSTLVVQEHFRAVSDEVRPEKRAVWLLDKFDDLLERYVETYYHAHQHSGLRMSPNDAEALSYRSHGSGRLARINYDEQFRALTMPSVRNGEVKVQPQGVKANYIFYDAPCLHRPGVLGTKVPVKYDPWNCGVAYAFIAGRWERLASEHSSVFTGVSERKLRSISAAMRAQSKTTNRNAAINARDLALFMGSAKEDESFLRQQRNDALAFSHRKKIDGLPCEHTPPDTTERTPTNVVPITAGHPSKVMRNRKTVGIGDL